MKRYLVVLILIVATLGCTAPPADGGPSAGVTLELSSSTVSAGSSTAITATIVNPWENDLENGVLQLLPARAEITFDNNGRISGIDVLGSSSQIVYSGVDISNDAYSGTYNVYGDYCFHYVTTGYQRVVVSPGDSETPAISGYSSGPFTITFGGDPTINSLSNDHTMLLFTFANGYDGTVMADMDDSTTERRVKGVLAAIPADIFEIDPPSGWSCGEGGEDDLDTGQPTGTSCEDSEENLDQDMCDTTSQKMQSLCMSDGECLQCTSSINGECYNNNENALNWMYCCCNGLWYADNCPSGMDATDAVICSIEEPLMLSGQLQANFKLTLKEPVPDYETERTIRLQTDYDYCIRSNTVSITIS
jgi:hypothetical protein